MQGQSGSRWPWLARLANNQHGAVAYWQLIETGFTPGAIEHAVRVGRLHRVYRGVYAVGPLHLSREGRLMAAVLACGPDAVLSHSSAAEHWELIRTRGPVIAVSVAGHRRGHQGLHVHRLRQLDKRDRTRRDGIPITTVARTLTDLAASAPAKQLQRAINEAERRGLLKAGAMTGMLERHPRRAGTARLRSLIAGLDPQTRRSRSDLELEFLAFCRRHGIPTPVLNSEVEGYEVDFHWPGTGVIVELDTWDYHGTSITFEADRERDAHLVTRGYVVLRVTARRLETDAAALARAIRQLLQT